ncbi:MAG: MFS transporter [Gammaproteobacteria bacterium]|nr:MFS transporter [Gammaproteobacteria bacterium]MDH5799812.1 MFS transporter [Gammaproteobacteria bacterium]
MAHRFSNNQETDKALNHSIRDGVAYSVMAGAGETYLSAFALFFKANTAQIGLLASLPALVSSLAQLFSAWLSHKGPSRRQVILVGASLQALVWIPLIMLPVFSPEFAVPAIILCVILYHACGSVVVPQWSSLMGDLVPERKRGRYFALRTRYTSVASFLALITAGIVLDRFEAQEATLYGFIAIFTIAAIARVVSVYHLLYLVEPEHTSIKLETPFSQSQRWWVRLAQSRFVQFSLFFASMQTVVAMASPFFAVYMLRDLQFTYVEFMATSAATIFMQFLALNTWGRISDTFGNRLILLVTGFAIPTIPILWLFSHNLFYLCIVQMLSGLVWAGFNLSATNFLYDLIPSHRRSAFLAFHNVAANIGVFCGAMLGGYLGTVLPKNISWGDTTLTWHSALLGVFLISALARLTIALIFLPRLREVREVRPITVTALIVRATRFSALSGLIYDIISGTKRPK